MRHRIDVWLALLVSALMLASCAAANPEETPDTDSYETTAGATDTDAGAAQSETIVSLGAYNLLRTGDRYTLISPEGSAEYADFRSLRTYDGAGNIRTHHILLREAAGKYKLFTLDESGVTAYGGSYESCSFYGDYVILDGQLYSGALTLLGPAYGEVESVAPLEEGGMITFAVQDSGAVVSYFRGLAGDIPNGADGAFHYRAFPHSQSSRGLYSDDDIYSLDEVIYLYTGGICYKTPIQATAVGEDNRIRNCIAGALFAEEGRFCFYRQFYSGDTGYSPKDMRFMEITHLDGEAQSGYFCITEAPRDGGDKRRLAQTGEQ